MTELPYEVLLSNGDRAEAETLPAATYAAATLLREASHAGSNLTVALYHNGRLVREGVRLSELQGGFHMSTMIRHPEIEVELVGHDGNAFAILGRVRRALEQGGVPEAEIDEFVQEATSGDYDHLLQTCMRWVEVS